jgi:ADP-heptose:LPS heptosyltransferase
MNILITRHDKIGDFILTLPMIKIAKEKLPNANIIVLVSKVNYQLAKSLDFIDDVILYEDNIFPLSNAIKKKKIDVSISAFTDTKLALALLIAGVKKRYAPATKFAQFFSNHRIPQRRSQVKMREFEYNIELLRAFDSNISSDFKKPLLTFSKDDKKEQLDLFKEKFNLSQDFRYVVFHPGFGGSSDGNLTLDDFMALAKSIALKKDIKIVFTFGPDDQKTKEYIQSRLDFDAILFDSALSLIDFCALLSNFELFISTSTGPMHLAATVNIKTVSFFGDSLFASEKRWGSINSKELQNNYSIPSNYSRELYLEIEERLGELINDK